MFHSIHESQTAAGMNKTVFTSWSVHQDKWGTMSVLSYLVMTLLLLSVIHLHLHRLLSGTVVNFENKTSWRSMTWHLKPVFTGWETFCRTIVGCKIAEDFTAHVWRFRLMSPDSQSQSKIVSTALQCSSCLLLSVIHLHTHSLLSGTVITRREGCVFIFMIHVFFFFASVQALSLLLSSLPPFLLLLSLLPGRPLQACCCCCCSLLQRRGAAWRQRRLERFLAGWSGKKKWKKKWGEDSEVSETHIFCHFLTPLLLIAFASPSACVCACVCLQWSLHWRRCSCATHLRSVGESSPSGEPKTGE